MSSYSVRSRTRSLFPGERTNPLTALWARMRHIHFPPVFFSRASRVASKSMSASSCSFPWAARRKVGAYMRTLMSLGSPRASLILAMSSPVWFKSRSFRGEPTFMTGPPYLKADLMIRS